MGGEWAYSSTFAVVLFFGLPFVGLGYYLWLCQRMRRERVPDMPILPLFLVFASYGTLLEILVTAVGDIPWSGMHSLGAFALVFGLSWMLPFYGVAQRPHSGLSPYHRITNLLLRIFPLTLIAVGTVIFLGLAAGMD